MCNMGQMWEVVYRYTSLDAFFNIIKTKKFRLCDITKSNDPLEGIYTLQTLEEAYQRLYRHKKINKNEWLLAHRVFFNFKENLFKEGHPKDFNGATSFCIPTHELMMLRSYADNGKGVALGVPINVLEKLAKNNPQLEFRKMEYLAKNEIVQYADDFWIKNIRKFEKDMVDIDEKTLLPFIDEINKCYYDSYFFKDKINADEEEYRLLFHDKSLFEPCIPCMEKVVSPDIGFDVNNGDLRAYYEIEIGDGEKASFYFNDIIIGPQCKATVGEVQAFLYRYDIRECSIQKNSWIRMR